MKYFLCAVIIFSLLSCSKKKEEKTKFEKFQEKIEKDLSSENDNQQQYSLEDSVEVVVKEEKIEIEKSSKKPDPSQVKPEETTEKVTENKVSNPSLLWQKYKKAKEELEVAKKQDSLPDIIQALQKASTFALELDRADIAAWQMNNICYYSIEHFKKNTKFDYRMERLNEMPSSKEKRQFYQETKEIMKSEFTILNQAKPFLQEAKKFDQQKPDEKRTRIIENNKTFIEEIEKMIQD